MQAIRDGRLVWHALPGSLHTESLDLEDLVRGMGFSSDLSRQTGTPLPLDAKMTDVASHTWILATILKRAGVEFLHIGSNSESASPELPRLFWWEGPDGSRLLTMYTAEGYGTGLKAPAGWPSKTWLALIHTNDNEGPPTATTCGNWWSRPSGNCPGVKLRFGRLSDFADAVLQGESAAAGGAGRHARHLDPRHRLDALRDGPGTAHPAADRHAGMPQHAAGRLGRQGARRQVRRGHGLRGEPALRRAHLGLLGGDIGWKYGEAWEKDRIASKADYDFAEESWSEKGDRIRVAERAITPALESDLAALARAVKRRRTADRGVQSAAVEPR